MRAPWPGGAPLVDAQQKHAAEDEQAARDLQPGQALVEKKVGDGGREDRFSGDDQVGDAGWQQAQADVV